MSMIPLPIELVLGELMDLTAQLKQGSKSGSQTASLAITLHPPPEMGRSPLHISLQD